MPVALEFVLLGNNEAAQTRKQANFILWHLAQAKLSNDFSTVNAGPSNYLSDR